MRNRTAVSPRCQAPRTWISIDTAWRTEYGVAPAHRAALYVQGGRLPVAAGNLPPAGSIWFGDSFDPATFEMSGVTLAVGVNQSFSFVAHLTRSVDAQELVIRVSFEGALVSQTSADATGSGDVWGFSPGPLLVTGTWRYDLADIGGNVLATGTIIAT